MATGGPFGYGPEGHKGPFGWGSAQFPKSVRKSALAGLTLEQWAAEQPKRAKDMRAVVVQTLQDAGAAGEARSKGLAPVITGRYRNTITHNVDARALTGWVGSNVKYAEWLENRKGLEGRGSGPAPKLRKASPPQTEPIDWDRIRKIDKVWRTTRTLGQGAEHAMEYLKRNLVARVRASWAEGVR
jgi:hypothetical protein